MRFQPYLAGFAGANSPCGLSKRRKCPLARLFGSRDSCISQPTRPNSYRQMRGFLRPGPAPSRTRTAKAPFRSGFLPYPVESVAPNRLHLARTQRYTPASTGLICCFPAGRPPRRLRVRHVYVSPAGLVKSTRLRLLPQTPAMCPAPHFRRRAREVSSRVTA